MNPYEAARLEAAKLRSELDSQGLDLNVGGYVLVTAACKWLGVALRPVKPEFALLKSADATILVARKFTLVRNDVPDDLKAFLVAHELGHLLLHPTTPGSIEVSQAALTGETESSGASAVEGYGARERQELQANVFAREFLLPRRQARDSFLKDGQSATCLAALRQLPLELVRLQLYDGILLPSIDKPTKVFRLPDTPTPAQKPAVDSDAPITLVEAGPGTGKTTTLLLRLRRLIASGVSPDDIVILTFSNKAARELVERARAGNIPGADRVWIGTFHAFGLEFLRKFGYLHGLEPRFPVLDKLASLAMLEPDVSKADLQYHDALSSPSPWLETIVDAIRRSKDEFYHAEQFEAVVNASPTVDKDTVGKLRDAATIFRRYEALLSERGAVDLTDLLCVATRLIQSGDAAVERFLDGINHLMVDEYQDVNRASALLVRGLAKKCNTVWVVGDANQAIYAFMGASSSNLESFQKDFPGAISIPLALNHRSSQEIVDAFGTVASFNPAGRPTTALKAERGHLGHGPRHIQSADSAEQLRALTWRIRELQKGGTTLAEQAIITYQNAVAAETAQGLEFLGVPILFLGNIFERGEIKDLICLLQLALDDAGTNLLRSWHASCIGLSRLGADIILLQAVEQKVGWWQVTGEGLSAEDTLAWRNLRRLCSLFEANASPWAALSSILLEDGQWLRELASKPGQASANALMAIWQFVFFCRTPDGTGRWATVKNLPQRIRDRVRLGEDRSMRSVPPEAEGMDAVRVLTAHGSKGLEFDAVHFVDVKASTYEPTRKPNSNAHIPTAVLDAGKSLDIHKNERHNLLYVAVSRPRFLLTVYTSVAQQLPSALNGLLTGLDGAWERSEVAVASQSKGADEAQVSLEEFLEFRRCPQRSEISSRGGRPQRDELKLHRAIDLATRRALGELEADASLLQGDEWRGCTDRALSHFGLHQHEVAELIRQRVEERALRGRDWLADGGTDGSTTTVSVGSLKVGLQPDQVIQVNGVKTLRFIRANKRSFDSIKQPLAALLSAHHKKGGEKMAIQIATLADGLVQSVGTVTGNTPAKYEAIAFDLCAGNFSGIPENGRVCHTCPYMFPCNKRPTEDD
jgi:superfamily I DNA/RNA helicase